MAANLPCISGDDFRTRPLDPLSFYDILPSDRVEVDPRGRHAERLGADLLPFAADEVDEAALDRFLLTCLADPDNTNGIDLATLADNASEAYARLLKGGKSDRGRRMKLQQLNFFCRDMMDMHEAAQDTPWVKLGSRPVWDWLPLASGGELLIRSGENGFQWTLNGKSGEQDCGFPSQIDEVGDGIYSIGSIFSHGTYLFRDGVFEHVVHNQPVPLVLSHNGRRLALDYSGTLFDLASGEVLARMPLQQIDRARRIGSSILAADWSEPRSVVRYDLDSRRNERIALQDILLLNDLSAVGDHYYAVCKQQGHIFKLDRDWRTVDRRMLFGRGPGRLFDPVSLRHHNKKLHVVNWVTASRVTTELF